MAWRTVPLIEFPNTAISTIASNYYNISNSGGQIFGLHVLSQYYKTVISESKFSTLVGTFSMLMSLKYYSMLSHNI